MVNTGNIHLLKQLPDGQKFEFSGSLEEFLVNCPDNLKMIEVEDICVIKISEGIAPNQVARNLKFLGTDSSDFNDDALDEYEDFDWGEYQFLPGVIQRQAVIIRAETQSVYQVVGIKFRNEVELFARIPPYLGTFLSETYGEENLLLENHWYTEGPGPVSWEGSDAIFLIRDFLLFASQGDGESDAYLVKIDSDEDLAGEIYQWLVDHGQLVSFILSNFTPNWSDADLLKSFQESIKKLLSNSSLVLNISDVQMQFLYNVIRGSITSDSKVLEIIETNNHPLTDALTQYLVALSNESTRGILISWGDFLSNVAKTKIDHKE